MDIESSAEPDYNVAITAGRKAYENADAGASLRVRKSFVERSVERMILASRWLLLPFYLGLAICIGILVIRFAQKMQKLIMYSLFSEGNEVVTNILSLIDLSLIANLLLVVMFSSYENFVARFEVGGRTYKPSWLGRVGFGELKLTLIMSINAISAVYLLDIFINIDQTSDIELQWSVIIQIVLIFTGVMMAIVQRLGGNSGH